MNTGSWDLWFSIPFLTKVCSFEISVSRESNRGRGRGRSTACYQFLCWFNPYGALPGLQLDSPLVDAGNGPELAGPLGQILSFKKKEARVMQNYHSNYFGIALRKGVVENFWVLQFLSLVGRGCSFSTMAWKWCIQIFVAKADNSYWSFVTVYMSLSRIGLDQFHFGALQDQVLETIVLLSWVV